MVVVQKQPILESRPISTPIFTFFVQKSKKKSFPPSLRHQFFPFLSFFIPPTYSSTQYFLFTFDTRFNYMPFPPHAKKKKRKKGNCVFDSWGRGRKTDATSHFVFLLLVLLLFKIRLGNDLRFLIDSGAGEAGESFTKHAK